MKITIGITLEEEDIDLARNIAIKKGLTARGGNLGPEIRGNIAALFRELLYDEVDRGIAKHGLLLRESMKGEGDAD